MKILSDFDGVWTNQALEADCVLIYLAAEAARLAGISADEAKGHFDRFAAMVRKEPVSFGWAPDGRITAFVDEDPFCVPNAICSLIDQGRDDLMRTYREAILTGGHENMSTFSDHCFRTGTGHYREEHPPGILAVAPQVVDGLKNLGADIVIVSNSPEEKIRAWFHGAGVEVDRHMRIRGEAGKQVLGKGGEAVQINGRSIVIDRPSYKKIIEEENPDLIIGDVLSLDLSLPGHLRRQGNPVAPRCLVLRKHPHTPDWAIGAIQEKMLDFVIEDLPELVDLVQREFVKS